MSSYVPFIRRGYAWRTVTSAVAEQSGKRRDHARAFAAQQRVARERARMTAQTHVYAEEAQTRGPSSNTPIFDEISKWVSETKAPEVVVEDTSPVEPSPEQPQPKNLAEALKQDYPGLEASLKDPSLGHKAIAAHFPFTSETSVRRWRKNNGVEVAK